MSVKRDIILLCVVALILHPFFVLAAESEEVNDANRCEVPARIAIEYLYPTEDSRDITTVNLNAYFRIKTIETINLSILAGLTSTYATGDIIQLEGDLNEGTLRESKFENEAVGIGPGILLDLRLWHGSKFSLHLNGSGSIIFYNQDFPAGGDRYNFMWRSGPVLRYNIGNRRGIGLGYLWMHVSNGQGIGPNNPSYDAQGLNLQYSVVF